MENINTLTKTDSTTQMPISFRTPTGDDGASIWRLVKDTKVLDVNSPYAYMIMCRHFDQTSIVAEAQNKLVGFVTGYVPPAKADTLFVWQVGVDLTIRSKGLATKLISRLLERNLNNHIQFLEATISPSNEPSRRLFEGIARKLKAEVTVTRFFSEGQFPENHEAEDLFRIGPFTNENFAQFNEEERV